MPMRHAQAGMHMPMQLMVCSAGPAQFAHANCTGNSLVGKLNCAPRPDALPSWADFSTLLASRWQGGSAGRFTHFIVWNEVTRLQNLEPSLIHDLRDMCTHGTLACICS